MINLFQASDFAFFKSLLTEAGKRAIKIQNSVIEVRRKRDSSIVTQADLAVQEFLIVQLKKRYDNFNFIFEEGFSGATNAIDDDTISIIIDPIDGSAMFSMYLPLWGSSIGVFKGYHPVYGFVYSPGLNLYFCNDDRYAYLNDEIKLVDRDIHIDTESNIFHASELHNKFFIDFPGKVRNLGSTALHACLTIDNARNRSVAFIGKSNLWDWAGAIPIILQARGDLKYVSGHDIDFWLVFENNYTFPDSLVA